MKIVHKKKDIFIKDKLVAYFSFNFNYKCVNNNQFLDL